MRSFLITILLLALSATWAWSFQDWEARLQVECGVAGAKLSFGQNADATDGIDGSFDVPPYSSANLEAVFVAQGGKKLWRDIKGSGVSKNWELHVESGFAGDMVISWDVKMLPVDRNLFLVDSVDGKSVNMKTNEQYVYSNKGPRDFWIEIE